MSVLEILSGRPEILTEDSVWQLGAENVNVDRESTADGVWESLSTDSLEEFELTQRDIRELLSQEKREREKRKFMDHVHNLRSKAQRALFDEFLQSVCANLRPDNVKLVNSCADFEAFAAVLSFLDEDKRNTIVSACKDFCDQFKLAPGFWEQSSAIEGLNTERNFLSPCSVADSAAAIIQAALKPADYPEADVSWAMLLALAYYSIRNAGVLDAAARKERQRLLKISASAGFFRNRKGNGEVALALATL